jgi:hypothetical protein
MFRELWPVTVWLSKSTSLSHRQRCPPLEMETVWELDVIDPVKSGRVVECEANAIGVRQVAAASKSFRA